MHGLNGMSRALEHKHRLVGTIEKWWQIFMQMFEIILERENACMCVCVCVYNCVRERKRNSEKAKARKLEKNLKDHQKRPRTN